MGSADATWAWLPSWVTGIISHDQQLSQQDPCFELLLQRVESHASLSLFQIKGLQHGARLKHMAPTIGFIYYAYNSSAYMHLSIYLSNYLV